MSVRVRSQLIVVVSQDADEKICEFKREDDNLTTVIETFDVEQSGNLVLNAAEANYALPMGKVVGGRILYIEADRQVTVRLDGEATGHVIGAPSTGTKAKLYLRGTFAAAPLITNNDATNIANVAYAIVGMK
jgi:hypothetical protein